MTVLSAAPIIFAWLVLILCAILSEGKVACKAPARHVSNEGTSCSWEGGRADGDDEDQSLSKQDSDQSQFIQKRLTVDTVETSERNDKDDKDATEKNENSQQLPAVESQISHNSTWRTRGDPGVAKYAGVTTNAEGDLPTFITGLLTNSGACLALMAFFMIARRQFPNVYEGLIIQKVAPDVQVQAGMFDWAILSLTPTLDQIQDSVGLDMATLLMFCQMSNRIFTLLCIPLLITAPVNFWFGGNAAGDDRLSRISFGNIVEGSKLYCGYAVLVWLVVVVVQRQIFKYMQMFTTHRERWLRELPATRSKTVLVQEIPDEYRSDTALKAFFEKMFGSNTVKSAVCVKDCPKLTQAVQRRNTAKQALEQAQWALSQAQDTTSEDVRSLQNELAKAGEEVEMQRMKVSAAAYIKGGVNASSGFVTFKSRRDAEIALVAVYSADAGQWEVSLPPPTAAVQWETLKRESTTKWIGTLIGYLLIGLLYMAYLPCVIWITQIATHINFGPLQPFWAALAPTMGLQFMVAFLPTFIINISKFCDSLPDGALAQQHLQGYYFWFQVIFILLVTAIGEHLSTFMETLVMRPLNVFSILANTMPAATHFYMNFLVLQWVTHFTNLTRIVPLMKYCVFIEVFEPARAKELSEPEDQDYYGMGSRCARFTINVCIGIVYGTLSPLISLLALVNFCICRLVYGYLVVFAETKKPDLGGSFFVHQLKNLFVGTAIYCIMMTGVLFGRATSRVPGLIAAASLPYVLWSYNRFCTHFNWKKLPLHEVDEIVFSREPTVQDSYVQPEFIDDL